MAKISVEHLTFSYDGYFDNIFEDVSFSIDSDWKLGFVARNGRGKTTFLNLLMGRYEYAGTILSNLTFQYFPVVIVLYYAISRLIEKRYFNLEKYTV